MLPPLGIFNQMWAEPAKSDRQAVRDAIDGITLADALGFSSVWIGEHHTARRDAAFYGRIPAPEIFLAHIAAKTSRIIVGTGVKVLPSTTAQRAAEEMSLLDLLVEGRAEFGIGLGANVPGAKPRAERAADFRALLADILRLLAGDFSGGLPELAPRPDPSLARRLWVAARDDETVAFAAAQNLNFVVGQAEIAPRQVAQTRNYRDRGGTGLVRGARIAFVAETHAEAERDSEAAARLYFGQMAGKNHHKEAVDAGQLPPTADTLAEMRRQVSFIVGTPAEVAAELNAYVEMLNLDRLDVMAQVPGLSTDAVRRSLTLLQNEVRPKLRSRRSRVDDQ